LNENKKNLTPFVVKMVGLGSSRFSHVNAQKCVTAMIASC